MTRQQKISKLGNAIKDYRGAYVPDSGKWVRAPDRRALDRVTVWLRRLHLDVAGSMKFIDEFHSFGEFNKWIGGL